MTTTRAATDFAGAPCADAAHTHEAAEALVKLLPATATRLGDDGEQVVAVSELRPGDRVLIRNCGAYTSSYASVGFNGFAPLKSFVI